MLIATRLLFLAPKILKNKKILNDDLLDYKIEVVGNRKNLVLIYDSLKIKTINMLRQIVRYESAFSHIEYSDKIVCIFFVIPNHLYYLVDYYLNIIKDIQSNTTDFESFNTKSPDYRKIARA